MNIERLSIDSYGHFHGAELGPFTGGIIVVHGPNEAGKTTLLAFIQAMLFGFPRKTDALSIPALNGSAAGGRIVVRDAAGERFTIARREGVRGGPVTVTAEDGSEMGAAHLSVLLGDASVDIFRNVFAFGLDQLHSVSSLNGKEISSQVYGAGLGTQQLPAALDELGKRAGNIFKPTGSNQPVHELLTELEDINGRLREQNDDSVTYSRLQTELARFTQESHDLRESYRRFQAERGEVDAVLDAEKTVQRALVRLANERARDPSIDGDRVAERAAALHAAEQGNDQLVALNRQLHEEERRMAATVTPAGLPLASMALLFAAGIAIAVGTVVGGTLLLAGIVTALAFGALAVVLFLSGQRQSSARSAQAQRVAHARAAYLAQRDRLAVLLRELDIEESSDVTRSLAEARAELDSAGNSLRSHADRITWLEQQLAEHESDLAQARAGLRLEDGVDLEARARAIEDEIERTEGLIAEREQLVGETREAIRRLEEGASQGARLRALREQRLEALREAADEWAGYVLAREILMRSQKRFEDAHQPAVVQIAQSYLRTITAGRYERITASPDKKEFQVFQPNGARKLDRELSRGAREQLYLALRFGYITEFGRKSARLPVIVDDILVNFDPARARAAAQAFAELSATNQILVFTCHPTTVEHFQAVSDDVQVIDLEIVAAALVQQSGPLSAV